MAVFHPPGGNDPQIQELLRKAGLDENSVIDPVSYKALQKILSADDSFCGVLVNPRDTSPSIVTLQQLPPPVPLSSSIRSNLTEQHMASVTRLRKTLCKDDEDNKEEKIGNSEDRIMRLLEQQTNMILSLHQRMDDLTALVHRTQQRTEGPGNFSGSPRDEINRQMDDLYAKIEQYKHFGNNCQPTCASPPQQHSLPPQHQQDPNLGYPLQQQPQPGPDHPTMSSPHPLPPQHEDARETPVAGPAGPPPRSLLYQLGGKMWTAGKLLGALRRRRAPNFDVALIIKVLVMTIILLSRFSRKQQQQQAASGTDDEEELLNFRLVSLVTLVIVGLFVSTGLIRVLYIFHVQENYFYRLFWKGEDIEDVEQEAQQASERHDQPQAGNEGGQRNLLGNNFLFGVGIEPAENEQYGVVRLAKDILFLLMSFFLSIFPMWNPEAAFAAQRPLGQDEDDGADDGTGLPEYRPPADMLQAAEDDDDDDGEEEIEFQHPE